uniref:Uncharacterized protein n=1 Tax=Erpetoichthys calabaricus TaxID=27687 RepID=A0A8C4X8D0_ERPCA
MSKASGKGGDALGQQLRKVSLWKYDPERSTYSQAFNLWERLNRWLRPKGDNGQQVVEFIACFFLVSTLPQCLAQLAWGQTITNLINLIEVVERSKAASHSGRIAYSQDGTQPGCVPNFQPCHYHLERVPKPLVSRLRPVLSSKGVSAVTERAG